MSRYSKFLSSKKNTKNENFKITSIKNLNSNNILLESFDIYNLDKVNDIIISLTTIPARLMDENFMLVIDSLYNQILKPKYIYIHLCKIYKRNFTFDTEKVNEICNLIKEKYDNIIINYTEDYGPITKILGLLTVKETFTDNTKIIVVDDDWILNPLLTLYYELCYELYNCECIGINERDLINWPNGNIDAPLECLQIFYDNYQNFLFGWLTFSIKFKYVKQIYAFYNNIIKENDLISNHDDLIMTLFYKANNIYTCGINIIFNKLDILSLVDTDALKNIGNSYEFRKELEEKYLNKYNYPLIYKNQHVYIDNKNDYNQTFIAADKDPRWLLRNVTNIEFGNNNNIIFTYFNNNIIVLTITFFDEIKNSFELKINNEILTIQIDPHNWSQKQSFFINIDTEIKYNTIQYIDLPILQMFDYFTSTREQFYKTSIILNRLPDLNYKLLPKIIRNRFIYTTFPINIADCFSSFNNDTFRNELFIALYIYKLGGLYIGNNNILYKSLYNLDKELFIADTNDFIYSQPQQPSIKKYVIKLLSNIIFNTYSIGTSIEIINKLPNIVADNNIISKAESNIDMSLNSLTLNYIPIPCNKINFIDHIAWINLKRSDNRCKYMEKLLELIKIPNTRIPAVDGADVKLHDKIPSLTLSHLSVYELATVFSHIRAISYLSTLPGNYFMVCEDDISLKNLFLFKEDLKEIIANSPVFDILQIQKITYFKPIQDVYSKWDDIYYDTGMIPGAAAYIISKEGIKNFMTNVARIEDSKFVIINKNIKVADIYVFLYVNTYLYKYNFINTLDKDSEIHKEHLTAHRNSSRYELSRILERYIT